MYPVQALKALYVSLSHLFPSSLLTTLCLSNNRIRRLPRRRPSPPPPHEVRSRARRGCRHPQLHLGLCAACARRQPAKISGPVRTHVWWRKGWWEGGVLERNAWHKASRGRLSKQESEVRSIPLDLAVWWCRSTRAASMIESHCCKDLIHPCPLRVAGSHPLLVRGRGLGTSSSASGPSIYCLSYQNPPPSLT